MRDHATVSPEKFQGTLLCQESSIVQHQIAIPIEELGASLEAAKEEKHVTNSYVDNNQNPEETKEKGECRYCQVEDFVSKLESPCNCNGSLKYVHRRCLDQWSNSRCCMILCEICMKPYGPDYYSVPKVLSDDDDTEMTISEEWSIPGTNTQIRSPLLVAERVTNGLINSMNKDFNLRNPSGGVIFGTALLIFMAVLLIKDACMCTPPKEDKFVHFLYCTMTTISVLIYVLSWILQCQI